MCKRTREACKEMISTNRRIFYYIASERRLILEQNNNFVIWYRSDGKDGEKRVKYSRIMWYIVTVIIIKAVIYVSGYAFVRELEEFIIKSRYFHIIDNL